MKSSHIVFVGRFQPFHLGHKSIVDSALENAEKVIIVIGSYRTPLGLMNPWTFEERKEMILTVMKGHAGRLIIVPLRDYIYSDITWITALQNQVARVVTEVDKVKMIGHFKDDTSVYLRFFPQWPLIERPNYRGINATDIRESYYQGRIDSELLPVGLSVWLKQWKEDYPERYGKLVSERQFISDYRKSWENTPFPVNFVTTDAVVVQDGHILLVRRKINPGKDKLALPGGFVSPNETIFNSCLRELKEETNLSRNIENYVKDNYVFDHPKRSLRGRTITHAYLFELPKGNPLPPVKGGDDAAEAFWIPFNDLVLHEDNMMDDHLHIIQHFINVG